MVLHPPRRSRLQQARSVLIGTTKSQSHNGWQSQYALLSIVITVLFTLIPGAFAQSSEDYPTRLKGTAEELIGAEQASEFEPQLPRNAEIRWQVYVPDTYDPAKPAGLMIYISPTRSGRIPRSWQRLMSEHNLIWLGADRNGNSVPVLRRMVTALLSEELGKREFSIDPDRVYLSGFSGGGRVISYVGAVFPERFQGGIYIAGVEHGNPGLQPKPAYYDNRHVVIIGQEDTAGDEVRTKFRSIVEAGAKHTLLLEPRNLGHNLPSANDFDTAIEFLDQREQPTDATE